MSAIAGILNLNGEPVSIEQSTGMMKALEKFPANDIQTWHKDNLFLGCHAQWITPESIGEQLPFYDYERRLAITADAIIDNREELFQLLQIDREDRKKITDSQLILLAYHKWGEESPKFLVGDFAYVIWDEKEQKLFGARDFSGSRTLYYFKDGQRFVFCTVMKPMLGLEFVSNELNEMWIAEYLANPGMYESVDPNLTVYKKLQQLPPSHSITIHNYQVKLNRYCLLTNDKKLQYKSDEEYVEAFREVFSDAVNSKLRTHLKVGAHLSGGLDSGSVASFASKQLKSGGKPLYSFSYVPVDDFVDWTPRSRIPNERPLIEKTVEYIGNISSEFLSFRERNSYTEIEEWLNTIEMPYKFFENTYWLRGIYEEACKQGIGVLLNGQRGNWSISWGPSFDYYAMLLKQLKLFKLFREVNTYSNRLGAKRRRVMSVVNSKAFSTGNKKIAEEDLFPSYINKSFANKTNVIEILTKHGIDVGGRLNSSVYQIRMDQFQKVYYWNTTGTYGSKLSLRYGVVDRDPTNDLRVIRYCLSVPENQVVKNGLDRALIRRATEGYLPEDIRLNMLTRGLQGADGIQRMTSIWNTFIHELEEMLHDPIATDILNLDVMRKALKTIKDNPKGNMVFEFDFKILMRSLILFRFIKSFD
ncbi:asparagine synthase-related protein [Robertmurraya sp. P23]|uniref:asparagine synthase-related protein n=1 Tax=Robertmurraya sp. P23 TaxID=3436931 RepID=UPI003D975A33